MAKVEIILFPRARRAYRIYEESQLPIYAGYATLYFLMSAVPLLMFLLVAVNLTPGFSVHDFTAFLFQFIPDLPQVQRFVARMLKNLHDQSSGTVASVAALTTLWSASSSVSAIQTGLKKITLGTSTTLWDKPRAVAYTFLLALMMGMLVVFDVLGGSLQQLLQSVSDTLGLAAPAALTAFAAQTGGVFKVGRILPWLMVVLVLTLTYTFLPGGNRPLRGQLPGAVFTTLVSLAFSHAFAYAIPRFWGASPVYGSLAAVFLLTMWLRAIISILFLGAIVNRLLAKA